MKTFTLMVVAVLSFLSAIAQNRTVSGRVTDANGNAVPFASVTIRGTTRGVAADAEGRFILQNVPVGATLVITSQGFASREVTVPASGDVSVQLAASTESLAEVVVTSAFGIRRSQRITPYSAQVLSDEQLRIIPQTNVNNALAGKVAGAQFRGQSAVKLNDQGSLRLRGGLSTSDVAPLYVVDGTPVNSFDVNPDDIADVTILKGVNATVLFGERARGGAIVITTKKRGEGAAGIEVNQGVTFDRVYILPRYQNLYAGGSTDELIQYRWQPGHPQEWQALDGQYYHDFTDDASWGPRMVGQQYLPWYAWIPGHADFGKTTALVPQPDNARDFWRTGITNVTNVAFSRGGQGYTFRVSYTNNSIRGMLPNTSAFRNTLNTSMSFDVNKFTIAANINYLNQRIYGEFSDVYSNQSTGSFNSWFHRDIDMNKMRQLRGLRTPIGTYASWNMATNPSAGSTDSYRGNYWYNFFTYFDLIDNRQTRDRLYGDASVTYNFSNAFKLRGTIRRNTLNTNYQNITPSELQTSALQTGTLASYSSGQSRNNENNYELLASYNNRFANDRLNLSLSAGANLLRINFNTNEFATSGGLNIPGFYAISNSRNNPTLTNTRERYENRAGFVFGDLEWNRVFALNFALRNDWYSTNPPGNDLLSYSVGGSFFFSDYTRNAMPWLSFGKVFASYGKKPTPLGTYQNNFAYTLNQNQWNGNFLMTAPNTLIDSSTVGSLISTFEAGIDLRFINNRFGVNFTYFDELNDRAPLTIPVSGISGYTSQLRNVGRIVRKGIEVQLTARPISRKNFTWDITKNFAYLIDNTVQDVGEGDRLLVGGGANFSGGSIIPPRVYQVEGKQWGQLIGGGMRYNDQGIPLIDPSMPGGTIYPSNPNKEYGSVVPRTTGGLINLLTYKSLSLGFTIDYQIGGKFFSLSEAFGHYSGLLEATAATNDRGWNVRDDVSVGGGVHVVGVDAADGKTPVDMYVDAQTYFHSFFTGQIWDPYVHDLTFVKLREVSIGYQFPVSRWGIPWFKGATLSVVARNPWLIYSASKNFDPSEITGIYGENGQLPGTRSLGFNLRLNF